MPSNKEWEFRDNDCRDDGLGLEFHRQKGATWEELSKETLSEYVRTLYHSTLNQIIGELKGLKNTQKIPWQSLKLAGGCPHCGAEANQAVIDNYFKEAANEALDQAIQIVKSKMEVTNDKKN